MIVDGSAPIDRDVCPNDEILKAVLNLQSDDSLSVQVREHLAQCQSCQRRLDQLTSSPDLKAVHRQSHRGWGESARKLVSHIAKEFSNKLIAGQRDAIQFTETQQIAADTEVSQDGLDANRLDEVEFEDLPKTIGRYSVLKELGRGGSGVVYLAFDPEINRKIAVKRIHSTSGSQKSRLIREAKAAAKLQIDQVVRVYSIESDDDGNPFITMEFVEGQTLSAEIQQFRYLPTDRAVMICIEMATAVQSAHDRGMLHRDIKPGNILMDHEGRAKLADFGLAQLGESVPQLTKTGVLLGTPAYMSPEQAVGAELDARSDVYSLGCVLYECLTGSMPFYGTTHQVLKQIAEEQPVSMLKLNENIPRELHLICRMAMAKRPENRYVSADAFRQDLIAATNGDAIVAKPETAMQTASRWYRKNETIAWLSGMVATLLIATTIVSLVSARQISKESQKAILASQESKRMALEADKQRALAVETLNELVFDIQNKLKGKPGTIQVKQAILETALEGLRKVVADGDSLFAIDHANCTAYLRMADIELARGNNDASKDYYQKAIQTAREINERYPNEIQGKIDLATALLGLTDAKVTGFELEDALRDYQQVLQLRESIAELEPTAENRFDHGRILGRIGSVLSSLGRHFEAIDYYEKSVQLMAPFQSEINNDPIFARSFAIANSGLANQLVLVNQIDRAQKHLDILIEISERLLKLDPYNGEYLLDAAVALGQMTQIHVQRHEWEEANQSAIDTRKMHERIVELNPENSWSRSNLGLSWSTEALTLLALNDLQQAETAWENDIRIQEEVLVGNPENPRFLLPAAEAAVYLAGIGMRRGRLEIALKHAQKAKSLLAQIPTAMAASNQMVQRAIAISTILPKTIELANDHLDRQQDLPLDTDVQKYAGALIAYQKAATGEFDDSLTMADSIAMDSFDDPLVGEYSNFLLAAAYSKLLRLAKEDDSKLERRNDLVSKTVANLDRFITTPAYFQLVMADPDFEPIRMEDAFMSEVSRWQTPN